MLNYSHRELVLAIEGYAFANRHNLQIAVRGFLCSNFNFDPTWPSHHDQKAILSKQLYKNG